MDFYDGDGAPFDVKGPPSPGPSDKWPFIAENAVRALLRALRAPPFPNGRTREPELPRVVLDSTYLVGPDHRALWTELERQARPEELARIFEVVTQVGAQR